ncbi:zinc-binding alcohol dehydrogenase family protein [Phenylobacterium deserti]|uniref:Zinc-type alcohol dehydrogenase-like protein n=1 Tax=Phenylobacterium deserti TaxID=1914756 RepID=A0A328AV18_9CAUL|nr:zinc-binding alcohol dehydrogenase family protein [Phenylobacterium deserti]RAK58021.1 zinc-binding alcohol dehydrogenase family protein [Phenylobacterium deserti]
MKAVGYREPGPIDRPQALEDIEVAAPTPGPHDLLVEVRAVSVNPADYKIRKNVRPESGHRILGWDAAGVVLAAGAEVTGFKAGDEVFYAGAIDRAGSNAEQQVVDARIAGPKPKNLSFAEAAALPLTAITAWEALFDRFPIRRSPESKGSILIVGGAGGVGSVAVQLARRLTGLTVIATASRPETQAWVRELGAHHVIDHSRPMAAQLVELGIQPEYVFSTTHSDVHFKDIAELIAPQGHLALIDDPETFDVAPLKRKSIAVHWELMFTRSIFQTPDMAEQGRLLAEVSRLVDEGVLKTTLADHFGPINAENLIRAHAFVESGKARGKIVLEGF